MAKKAEQPKPKKVRADKYDEKLKVKGSFADLVKVAMNPKKPKK